MSALTSYLRAGLCGLALLPAAAVAQNTDTLLVARATEAGHTVSRLTVFKSGGLLAGGTFVGNYGFNQIPAEGAGTRMVWFPENAAFRAGYINGTQWDAANVGRYSIAAGYNARASGDYSTAFGQDVVAAQINSTAIGQYCTATGAASVALGYYAHTNARQGSFVFADRSVLDDGNVFTDEAFRAGANHSASWRVTGGFRIYTSSDRSTGVIFRYGNTTPTSDNTPNWFRSNAAISTSTDAYLSTSGVWQNSSDRRKKHRFEAVSGEAVLAQLRQVPITRWSYKTDADGVRHLGPMAQDFRRAFGLGPDSTSIGTIDADGVALAGVQTLDARTRQQQRQLSALQADNAALRARLATLETRTATPTTAGLPLAAGLALAGIGVGSLLRRRR